MATTATSNLARVRSIKEATFGTTPSTGTSKDLRFTGESLNYAIQTDTSKEIRADRQVADLVQLGSEASGDVQVELSYGSHDEFLAAALGGSWSTGSGTDTLTNGIAVPYFSLEKGFTDINQYLLFKGMAVNTMSLEFAIGAIITGSFGFMGKGAERSATTGVPTVGAAGDYTEVMNAATNFADLSIDGTTYPCGVSQVSLNTDAGLRAQNALGNLGACAINAGTFTPTGSFTVYFADGSIYDKYISNSAFELSWSVTDDVGNKYTFSLPRVKVTSANPVAGGLDQDVEMAVDFQALYDPTAEHTIKVTRTPKV